MKLTRKELDAALELKKGRLRAYRTGYASSTKGPFHSKATIMSLVRKSYAKVSPTGAVASMDDYQSEKLSQAIRAAVD